MSQPLRIDQIRTDGGTQPRAELDLTTIAEYAAAMQEGDQFPPVVVFHDGENYWLADGFHRLKAAEQIDFLDLPADVREGTRRDAVLFSVGANASHGLRRTNADKRQAVETLLRDEEWLAWSDREIARRCGVSHDFVSRLRGSICHSMTDTERKAQRGDSVYTINTERIGGTVRPKSFIPDTDPDPDEQPALTLAAGGAPALTASSPLLKLKEEEEPQEIQVREQQIGFPSEPERPPPGTVTPHDFAAEPMHMRVQTLANAAVRIVAPHLTGAEFKANAQPATLERARRCIPEAIAILEEIARDD